MASLRPAGATAAGTSAASDGATTPIGGQQARRSIREAARVSIPARASTTDPDALLSRQGPGMEARLCFAGHLLMENRNGLVVDAELTRASGHAERLAALAMVDRVPTRGRATLGADRGYDGRDFRAELSERWVTPYIACNTSGRRSAIDRASGSESGSRIERDRERSARSLAARRLDQDYDGSGPYPLSWLQHVRWSLTFAAAAYNPIRRPRLRGAAP